MKDVGKIVDSLSGGSMSAFDEFYSLYYNQVFHFAFFFLKDEEGCKEIVSDVFFSVWQFRAKLKEINNIEKWMYVITKNKCLRYIENNKKKNHYSLDDLTESAYLKFCEKEESVSSDHNLLDEEMERLLAEAISKLPKKCRTIFVMSRHEGLKTKEIAEILSLQEGTVRVQMKIAIEKITAAIKAHYPDIFLIVIALCSGFAPTSII